MKKSELTKLKESMQIVRDLNDELRKENADYKAKWEKASVESHSRLNEIRRLEPLLEREKKRCETLLDLLVDERNPTVMTTMKFRVAAPDQ